MKEKAITKESTIMEALEANPNSAQVFARFGMHCLGCLVASGETIEEAAIAHGIPLEELLAALNQKETQE